MQSSASGDRQDQLSFESDGACHYKAILDNHTLNGIITALSGLPSNKAGSRLKGITSLTPYLSIDGAVGAVAACLLGPEAKPVRALLFNKTASANWRLGWHQDRAIAVKRRVEVEGYGPWTVKKGMLHVAPPFSLLAGMITLRVHLDEVGSDNAPLLIAPGSHRLGYVPEPEISAAVERCGDFTCLAAAGDIWLYATPIIHASESARSPTHRRVLQVDYCACDLPAGLDWLGV